jgi:hypothetical protein
MTDEQILNLVASVLAYGATVIGTLIFATWWVKGQFTSAEMAGLREQNKAHELWRGFAEAQTKKIQEELTRVQAELTTAQATIETLKTQIAAGASKETLAGTATITSGAVTSALAANTTASTVLRDQLIIFEPKRTTMSRDDAAVYLKTYRDFLANYERQKTGPVEGKITPPPREEKPKLLFPTEKPGTSLSAARAIIVHA